MVNNAASGEGGGGSGVCRIYCASLISICNSLYMYFHARSLFQMYCIVYTQIFNIYKTIIKGNAGLGILA